MLAMSAGVNWRFFAQTFASWVGTLFIVGLSTAALFSAGVYAPSVSANKVIYLYENNVIGTGNAIVKDMQSTLNNFKNLSQAGVLTQLPYATWQSLNKTMVTYLADTSKMLTPSKVGTILPSESASSAWGLQQAPLLLSRSATRAKC
jgi:sodium-dependent phosphate transporter